MTLDIVLLHDSDNNTYHIMRPDKWKKKNFAKKKKKKLKDNKKNLWTIEIIMGTY